MIQEIEEFGAELEIRSLQETRVLEPLPTTVMGLLVHIAEHTQRHVGQAISAAKLARALTAR